MRNCVVIIPAYNEEETIVDVIQRIPKTIGKYNVTVLVIDDGSIDRTAENAMKNGCMVVSLGDNHGLGVALKIGLKKALELNPDIIVQLDADGQYLPEEINLLIKPIDDGIADLVLGSRLENIKYKMPRVKRLGNRFITKWVQILTNVQIKDAQTGFRAMNKNVAEMLELRLKASYTYTQEMIIHTVFNNFQIANVPITFCERKAGKSRLIQSTFSYLLNVLKITLKTFHEYRPMKFYGTLSILIIIFGLILLLVDNYLSLQGFHIIPTIDLSNDPKTLLTIFLPIIFGIILMMYATILESLRQVKENLISIRMNQELKKNHEKDDRFEK